MDKSMETLIASVTQRVLSELMNRENAPEEKCRGASALVIGSAAEVPDCLSENTRLCTLEDKSCLPESCGKVVITSLTTTQLADIAAGRAASPEACAVCTALLNGAEIYMLATAPEHRKYAGKCSPGFYNMLEGYVDTLKGFGIKITGCEPCWGRETGKNDCPAPPEKVQCGLITEKLALSMVRGKKTLTIPQNVIITPSAKDVFLHAGVTVLKEGEK